METAESCNGTHWWPPDSNCTVWCRRDRLKSLRVPTANTRSMRPRLPQMWWVNLFAKKTGNALIILLTVLGQRQCVTHNLCTAAAGVANLLNKRLPVSNTDSNWLRTAPYSPSTEYSRRNRSFDWSQWWRWFDSLTTRPRMTNCSTSSGRANRVERQFVLPHRTALVTEAVSRLPVKSTSYSAVWLPNALRDPGGPSWMPSLPLSPNRCREIESFPILSIAVTELGIFIGFVCR